MTVRFSPEGDNDGMACGLSAVGGDTTGLVNPVIESVLVLFVRVLPPIGPAMAHSALESGVVAGERGVLCLRNVELVRKQASNLDRQSSENEIHEQTIDIRAAIPIHRNGRPQQWWGAGIRWADDGEADG